ncbi:MAG: TolB family protein [Acidobacteriota bacterium]
MKKSIWRLASFFAAVVISASFAFTGCSKKDSSSVNPEEQQQKSESGTLLYEGVLDGIHQFDFATKTDLKLMEGTFPSRLPDGRIIFVYGSGDIVISSPDGSKQTTLFQSSAMLLCPQVSKDGNYVAFSNINTAAGIIVGTYIYKTDGTKVAEFKGVFHPAWTPDGRLIMSGSYNSVFKPQTPYAEGLYITDKQFTSTVRIDPSYKEPLMPSVSPDGKKVAFVLNGHIWKMNLDGTDASQITKGDSDEKYPSWSPDGKYIAFNGFVSGSLIGIVPSDGTSEVNSSAKCWVYSKKNEGLNSESQILWY